MNNEDELSKLNKNFKVSRWVSYGVWIVLAILIATPYDLIPQKFTVTMSLFVLAITASIYGSTLKRKIQNLEYRTLTEAVENAQIAALEAEINNSTKKSRAAKAMSGNAVSNPAASLQNLPQSADPEIRSFTTMEQIDQQTSLAAEKQKNLSLWANICLTIGIFSGIAGFVLPLGACTAVTSSGSSGLSGLSAGITAFFTVLFICIGVGVAFGTAAATMRSRSRAAGDRIHELKMQGIRVKASNPRG